MATKSPTHGPKMHLGEGPPEAEDLSALVIADRLASLGTLVAGVAHEINNPIAYVLGNLDELQRLVNAMREAILTYRARVGEQLGEAGADVIASAETKIFQSGGLEVLDELIGDAYEGAARIRELVRDLLEISRRSDRPTTSVDIHEILDSSLRLVAKQLAARAILKRDYQATCSIEADRPKLAQVVLNLVTNAIHACDAPGPDAHRIHVRTRDVPDGIELDIEDTGPGIPEEIRDKIFTPFFTTKEVGVGTGLGLYISRRIIEEHCGSISFRCDPSGGTIFTLRLPRSGRGSPHPPEEK